MPAGRSFTRGHAGLLAMGRAPDTTHHTRRVMPDFTSKMLNGFPPGGNAGCFDGRALRRELERAKKLLTPRARHAEHLHAQPASKLMKPVRLPPGWVSAVMEASRRYRHYSPLLAHK